MLILTTAVDDTGNISKMHINIPSSLLCLRKQNFQALKLFLVVPIASLDTGCCHAKCIFS